MNGPNRAIKTTSAEQIAKSVLYMTKPEEIKANLLMSEVDTSKLLSGKTPRLIDEWQLAHYMGCG